MNILAKWRWRVTPRLSTSKSITVKGISCKFITPSPWENIETKLMADFTDKWHSLNQNVCVHVYIFIQNEGNQESLFHWHNILCRRNCIFSSWILYMELARMQRCMRVNTTKNGNFAELIPISIIIVHWEESSFPRTKKYI